MLENNDKAKLEQYIDKLINGIYSDANRNIKNGVSDKQVIDKIINVTVNKFTPESKMILSSTYNMMMERTLAKELFRNVQNRAAFYETDILKGLNKKFNFEIPKNINYEESKNEINKWVKAGAVVVVGGIISIPLKSWIPVGIAVVIAGIMAFLLKDGTKKEKTNVNSLIKEYLNKVKQSLMLWIDSIEKYYDERISDLERELVN
ncbi:MAG: hypothetical protein ABF649_18220 [Bacillus sp. (in: firmicutes)]